MKTDFFGKESLTKNGLQVIREGFAVAKCGISLGECILGSGTEPISFEMGEAENGGLSAEEFLAKPFRILSAAVTPYRYFDFSKPGLLKSSVGLFDELTLYANHNADVNNWKGFTKSPVWDEKNKPNGINALLVVDKTVDPRLARGVEIGALKSASVTVWFEFEKSHPDLRYFYDHLGEEVDGEIVRLIVTSMTRAAEVSIVWEGEDPYAKALGAETQDSIKPDKGGKDMEFGKEFLKKFGMTGPDVEPAALEANITEKLADLESTIAKMKPAAELGNKHLETTRQKAVTLYKAARGESCKQSYIDNVILQADTDTAQAFVEEFQTGVDDAIPLTCPKCGEKLTRQSSRAAEAQGEKGKNVTDYKM